MKSVFSSKTLESGTIIVRWFGKYGAVEAIYRPQDLKYSEVSLLNRQGGQLSSVLTSGYLASFAKKEKVDPVSIFLLPTRFRSFLNYLKEREDGEFGEILENIELFPLPY